MSKRSRTVTIIRAQENADGGTNQAEITHPGVCLAWVGSREKLRVFTSLLFCEKWDTKKAEEVERYPARLKYCTARSCFSAAAFDEKVPKFFLFPVFASFFFEYKR